MVRPFLTAEWRHLSMLNYVVDPALLRDLVPAGTELDAFDGKHYVSLVGFRFLHTRVRGVWIPLHSNFDEVNLRFYVHRRQDGEDRRGVVFVREIVPRWAIARVAQTVFNENYISLPMRHQIAEPVSEFGRVKAEYSWRMEGRWCAIRTECSGRPAYPRDGSLEQFITEHYWGYTAQRNGATLEYQVEHDRWRMWSAEAAKFDGDVAGLYGAGLSEILQRPPDSAYHVEGSAVSVGFGKRL